MGSRMLRSSTLGVVSTPTRGDREENLMRVIENKKVIWKNPSCSTRDAKAKAWNEVASQCGTSVKDVKQLFDNVKGKAKTRIEAALKKGAGATWEDVSGFVSTYLLPRTPWPLWSAIPWFCHQVFDEIVQKAETDKAMSDKAASDTKNIVKEMLGEGITVTTSASNQYQIDIDQGQPISQGSSNNLVIDETPRIVASSSYANSSSFRGENNLETGCEIPTKKSRLTSTGGQGRGQTRNSVSTRAKRTKSTQPKLHIEAIPSASDVKRTTMDLKREKDDEYYADEGIPQYQNTGPPVGAEDNTDLPTVAPATPPSVFQNNVNPGLFQPQPGYPFCQPFQSTVDKDILRMYNQDVRHCFQSLFENQYRVVFADKPSYFAQQALRDLKVYYNSICAQPY